MAVKQEQMSNGNTRKYDNGKSGWTEYNSKGDAVASGTSSGSSTGGVSNANRKTSTSNGGSRQYNSDGTSYTDYSSDGKWVGGGFSGTENWTNGYSNIHDLDGNFAYQNRNSGSSGKSYVNNDSFDPNALYNSIMSQWNKQLTDFQSQLKTEQQAQQLAQTNQTNYLNSNKSVLNTTSQNQNQYTNGIGGYNPLKNTSPVGAQIKNPNAKQGAVSRYLAQDMWKDKL